MPVAPFRGLGGLAPGFSPGGPKGHGSPPAPGRARPHAGTARGTKMPKYLLKLYITGQTPRSQRAIDNLRRICEDELSGQYEMQVIDVLERPQLAEDEKILATPTVVKELPVP